MDIEDEDIARIQKKTKEIKIWRWQGMSEYAFADTPADSTYQFKIKIELLEKYKETKDMSSEETLKLYP